jgi:predicted metal-dependent TIM-barrel fold hydrolase
MRFIDTHAHMISRTTADYEAMVLSGCRAVCEPAFWAGWDRSSAQGFRDYFLHISEYEPKRAARFGLPHFCWLCVNAKESENVALAREVMEFIPELLQGETVLGVGEIGLNKNSKNELLILEEHIRLAADHDQLILVHTPHLEDKRKGTLLTLDLLEAEPRIDPGRVLIDHVEEHTVGEVLDRGYWAGMTLYPESKFTAPRAADIYDRFGPERLIVDSSADWGISDPLSVPKLAAEMRRRGVDEEAIDRFIYQNPHQFLSQCPKFKID